MVNIGKLIFLSALAIGLGIFLGTVPLTDGMTAAELGDAWFSGGASGAVHKARRIGTRPGDAARPVAMSATASATATTSVVPASAPAAPATRPAAPITAGAANSPEQTSETDKAALDRLISRRAAH